MLKVQQFSERIIRKLPQTLLNEKVLRIYADSIDEIHDEAESFFNTSVENLNFEIEYTLNTTEQKKYSVIAYPKDRYTSILGKENVIKHRDSFAFLRLGAGSILLLVTRPIGNGALLKYADVQNMILKRDSSLAFNQEAVKRSIEQVEEEWVRIGSFEYDETKDAKYSVSFDIDEMRAFLTFKAPERGGGDPSFNGMMQALKAEGVQFGINEEILLELERKPRYNEEILVAFGQEVQKGDDARIEIIAEHTSHLSTVKDKSIKKVIMVVKRGKVIAKKIPFTKGIDGQTTTGVILFAEPGKDIVMEGGKNVFITQDNTQAIAQVDGSVRVQDNKVYIQELLVVESGLSLEVGDINFPGSVWIKGDIPDDFELIVGGNLQVDGGIAKANLNVSGDLSVALGINGRGSSSVHVNGSISAKFIEGANISVGKDCIVEQAIISSNVFAKKRIIVVLGRGKVISSTLTAGSDIFVRSVGSALGESSTLEIKSAPEVRKFYDKLYAEKIQKMKELEENNRFIGKEDVNFITKILKADSVKEQSKLIHQDKRTKIIIEKLNKIKELQLELKNITKKQKVLKEHLSKERTTARLCVIQNLMSGTTIAIDDMKLIMKYDLKHVVLFQEEERIATRNYSAKLDGVAIERILKNVKQ